MMSAYLGKNRLPTYQGLVAALTAGALLVSASLLQFTASLFYQHSKAFRRIESTLPPNSLDWRALVLPLGDTLEMSNTVRDVLQYDDVASIRYEKLGKKIDLFATYWMDGSIEPRLVAAHTPDVCWVAQGWRRLEDLDDPYNYGGFGEGLRGNSANYRTFEKDGRKVYVVYWHIVFGDNKVASVERFEPSLKSVWKSLERGLRQKPEQIFLRVSLEQPFSQYELTNELVASLCNSIEEIVTVSRMVK